MQEKKKITLRILFGSIALLIVANYLLLNNSNIDLDNESIIGRIYVPSLILIFPTLLPLSILAFVSTFTKNKLEAILTWGGFGLGVILSFIAFATNTLLGAFFFEFIRFFLYPWRFLIECSGDGCTIFFWFLPQTVGLFLGIIGFSVSKVISLIRINKK